MLEIKNYKNELEIYKRKNNNIMSKDNELYLNNLKELQESHDKIEWVKYPFLKSHPKYEIAKKQMKAGGCVVAFEVKGGLEAGRNFFDSIQLLSLSANLGDARSIVTHPASTTHSKLTTEERNAVGISDGMVRVSVGLEHIDDIIADIAQALG